MRRARSAKEDEYRFLIAAGQPNFAGYGTIGDGVFAPPPRPIITVGGVIAITANVMLPAIAALDQYVVELLSFYDGIIPQAINQFFLPIGVCVVVGVAETGLPQPGGNVTVKFGLFSASYPDLTQIVSWQSASRMMDGTQSLVVSSLNYLQSDSQLIPSPLGVNSSNAAAAGAPFNQLNFSVANQHATNPTTEGGVRVVVWGLEA